MSDYFNRLPDEILAKILNRLSLQELAPLDLVSHRWKSVQEYVLKRIKSLTLFKEKFAFDHDDFFQLMFFEPLHYSPYKQNNSLVIQTRESPSVTKSRWLVNKLPNITKLSMWEPCYSDIDIDYLLDHWTGLEKLNIADYDLEDGSDDIWSRIKRLTLLKHLGLIFVYRINNSINFSQLETLCIEYSCSEKVKLSDLIVKLGPQIQHLSLSNYSCSEQELTIIRNALLQNDALAKALSNRVTHLTLRTNESSKLQNLSVLNFIADQFCSLTHLDINLNEDLYMHEIVGPLSRLTKLTSLRLSFYTPYSGEDAEYVKIYQGRTNLLGDGIRSVRKLHLASSVCTPATPNEYFYKKILPLAFPCLSELRFEKSIQLYKCEVCNSDYRMILQYRLFDGGLQCECANALWTTFCGMKLQVYRNTNIVYHHKMTTYEQFLVRLERFGQSPYRSIMND